MDAFRKDNRFHSFIFIIRYSSQMREIRKRGGGIKEMCFLFIVFRVVFRAYKNVEMCFELIRKVYRGRKITRALTTHLHNVLFIASNVINQVFHLLLSTYFNKFDLLNHFKRSLSSAIIMTLSLSSRILNIINELNTLTFNIIEYEIKLSTAM